ncbi:MAG: hypothetical protein U0939_26775 [Pirellulales bacterium]
MRRNTSVLRTASVWLLLALLLFNSTGCVGGIAQLIYVIKGNKIPAEFDGLAGKKVAVVCVANNSSYDPSAAASILSQLVEMRLRQNVKNIKVVRQQEVANWIDNNDWDQTDFRDIGKAVNADLVLGIDLDGYRLHEDATMFKGRANVTLTVYDMSQGGDAVFRRTLDNFAFPINGGQHVSETTDTQFQRKFLATLSQDIAKHFYPYEFNDEFARDADMLH